MKQTRRSVLGAIGAVATIGIGATQVIGTDKLSIKIDINAEDEYITLKNTGDSKATSQTIVSTSNTAIKLLKTNPSRTTRSFLPVTQSVSALVLKLKATLIRALAMKSNAQQRESRRCCFAEYGR